ncbi:hypothetical protein VB776_16655 [Arcicella sp. DC2W]|uniref:Delta-aminolevulinic acid dehydratase n=1 Tax=Arcicella gelida TaxID=2984195 RepID=A0ABU5S826_9BACT|nr:delta-aminolevulinic acid dehydratase [Arcicella sp. DC2W]MEA5404565.1 hypothetical protein [Arcicella sp. DC2W]
MIEHKQVFEKLKNYCEDNNFKGYDPFDGLNSTFFQSVPFAKNNSLIRLTWLQFFKRSPINLRKIAGVSKDFNPKGLGLFLQGYCNIYKINPQKEYLNKIEYIIGEIKKLVSPGYSGDCWGYNFDWQARAFFQPKGTPSVVVTSYIACGLLDAYEILKSEELLKMARSACDFVLKDLNRTYDNDGDFSFSYCPLDHTQVFNASLLGARILCRVYYYTQEEILISESKKVVSFVCKYQNPNGSWAYSPLPYHKWIDNFHTGYNLECIYLYKTVSNDDSFDEFIDKGLDYYLNTFFEESGLPKYYSDSKYPIDMHTTAQLIVTLYKLGKLNENIKLVEKVLKWSFDNMFDHKRGYFYYYKEKWGTIKISYIRWIQAWMFVGLSYYITFDENEKN